MNHGGRQEKRAKSRVDLAVTMPIHLSDVASNMSIDCRLYDVSATGIGVLLQKPLSAGQVVSFQTLGKTWQLEVSWCEKAGKGFRCGLTLVDKSQDMSALFSSFSDYRGVG